MKQFGLDISAYNYKHLHLYSIGRFKLNPDSSNSAEGKLLVSRILCTALTCPPHFDFSRNVFQFLTKLEKFQLFIKDQLFVGYVL